MIKTAVALLIFLGSSLDMSAFQYSDTPSFDIFKAHIGARYNLTDHLMVKVNHDGHIALVLTSFHFTIENGEKSKSLQHIEDYPDLRSNTWTKEWKASDLPIFCKAEHQIQKKSGIAFRFRLGSLDYVNSLEGK